MHVVVLVFTLEVLHHEVVDVVASVGHLHRVVLAEAIVKKIDGLVLVHGGGESDAQVVVHRLVRQADRLLCHEAEVLAAHAEAELKHLVGTTVDEIGHAELADIVLVFVDVIVLETDGILVHPIGLAFQVRRELESFGREGLAKLHLHRFGILEAHHDGFAGCHHTRGVAVEQRQQHLVDGLDTFNEGVLSAFPLLATRGQEAKQHHCSQQADAADSFHSFNSHIIRNLIGFSMAQK